MKYRVMGTVVVSCWTVVDADSPEEAIDKAELMDMAEIHIDGSYPEDEYWHIDIDGIPSELRAEED